MISMPRYCPLTHRNKVSASVGIVFNVRLESNGPQEWEMTYGWQGSRDLLTLHSDGIKKGVVTLCIGGGQGIALALESMS